MSKVTVKLSESGICDLKKAAEDYKDWLVDKTKTLVEMLGEYGWAIADVKFGQAIYDGTNDVTVEVVPGNNTSRTFQAIVKADGQAVLFIEFGTGITYTTPDHPENAYQRGTYGYGLGASITGWRYKGDPGTNGYVIQKGKHAGEVHTYGNPANRCMYDTKKLLEYHFTYLTNQVFRS